MEPKNRSYPGAVAFQPAASKALKASGSTRLRPRPARYRSAQHQDKRWDIRPAADGICSACRCVPARWSRRGDVHGRPATGRKSMKHSIRRDCGTQMVTATRRTTRQRSLRNAATGLVGAVVAGLAVWVLSILMAGVDLTVGAPGQRRGHGRPAVGRPDGGTGRRRGLGTDTGVAGWAAPGTVDAPGVSIAALVLAVSLLGPCPWGPPAPCWCVCRHAPRGRRHPHPGTHHVRQTRKGPLAQRWRLRVAGSSPELVRATGCPGRVAGSAVLGYAIITRAGEAVAGVLRGDADR